MKITIIGHAYSASYNRKDKLVRMINHPRVTELQLIVPQKWYDKPLQLDRSFIREEFDSQYRVDAVSAMFTSSQPKYVFNPVSLQTALKSFNPDIIYLEQEPHDLVSSEIAMLNSSILKKPIVMFTWENIDRAFSIPRQVLRSTVIQKMDGFVTGNNEAKELIGEMSKKPTAVIPQFGVDVDRFAQINVDGLKTELNLEDAYVFGYVGRYIEDKGIKTLVDAFKQVRKGSEKRIVLICLSSMAPPPWMVQLQNECGDDVLLLSQIDHNEFPQYMNLFDVLVLPSQTTREWKEQFGRVLIEAMACGIPAIGSSSGAIPEVVGENGLIFQEKNVASLAETMLKMMNHRDKIPSAEKIRLSIIENYSHDVVVDKLVSFLEEVKIGR